MLDAIAMVVQCCDGTRFFLPARAGQTENSVEIRGIGARRVTENRIGREGRWLRQQSSKDHRRARHRMMV